MDTVWITGEAHYTDSEIAEMLRVSRKTLFNLRRRGLLQHIQAGTRILYSPKQIRDFLEKASA